MFNIYFFASDKYGVNDPDTGFTYEGMGNLLRYVGLENKGTDNKSSSANRHVKGICGLHGRVMGTLQ